MKTPGFRRRHIRLWLVLVLVATLVASMSILAISLSYRVDVEQRYMSGLQHELNSDLNALKTADFSPEAAEFLSGQGLQVMLLQEDSGELLFLEDWGMPIFPVPEPENETGRARGPRNHRGERGDDDVLRELVQERLGQEDGSFFISDNDLRATPRRQLESIALYLCGRGAGRLFCLVLPVGSTNAAMELAIRYSTQISIYIWIISVILLYVLATLITKPHRRIAEIAANVAQLDFSRRCPDALTTELSELSRSVNTMADSLEANVKALRDANEQLQSELNARIRQQSATTELIGNLSHDLKTPIAIISSYAEGLQEGVAKTPEKQRTYYEIILRESEEMQIIVSRMLALNRLESGAVEIDPEDFDLTVLLDEILSSFQLALERRGLRLDRVGSRPCMVHADYECARQSLMNYVQNALYHINNGTHIEVRLADRGALVRVQVRNSSAPIPPEKAAKLWNKLYRGDPSRQRQNGEIGLGLSIVKGNMERLGCAYGFENDPDFPGVCFWLELPKADRDRHN